MYMVPFVSLETPIWRLCDFGAEPTYLGQGYIFSPLEAMKRLHDS